MPPIPSPAADALPNQRFSQYKKKTGPGRGDSWQVRIGIEKTNRAMEDHRPEGGN
jgi:hypothetical protein